MTALPPGWTRVELSEVCEVIQGQSPPGSTYNADGDGLPFYQGKADFGELFPTPRKWCTAPKKVAEPGDVLISVRAPVGPTNLALEQSAIGRGLATLRPGAGIQSKYLLYALRASERDLARRGSGSTFAAITGPTLRKHLISLAPAEERAAIVEEIEKHFTRLDAARSTLEGVTLLLKRYRAGVLHHAVTGRGVGQPDWDEVEVGTVAEIVTGNTPSTKESSFYGGSIPFFKPADLNAGYYVRESAATLTETGGARARIVPVGSVMVTSIGATTGKVGLARVSGATNQQINSLVITDPARVLPEWVYWFFVSPIGQQLIWSNTSSTTMPILNKGRFTRLRVPLPPLEVQSEIVLRLERSISVIDGLSVEVERLQRVGQRLRQGLLGKALAGALPVRTVA